MDKKLLKLELAGLLFCAACSAFMRSVYALSGGSLPGLLFGAVNDSCWECCKTLLFSYLLWAVIEVMCLGRRVHRIAVAKTAALYALGVLYLGLCALYHGLDGKNTQAAELAFAAVSVTLAFALSYALTVSPLKVERLFAPSLFLLFLLWSLYFSLTPFPVRNYLFMDRATGMYGILPRNLDYGAVALDTIFVR